LKKLFPFSLFSTFSPLFSSFLLFSPLFFHFFHFSPFFELWNYKIAGAHELGTYNKVGALELRDYLIEGTVVGGLVNVAYTACSARDWERSGLLEENPQSGCTEIRASLKGPL
jgi:hypothetical protein